MRNLILAVIVFLSFQATAQLSLNGGKYVYHKSHRLSGSGEELYSKAYEWISKNMDTNKTTISSDKDELVIKVKSSYDGEMKGLPNTVSYTYKIEFLSGVCRETYTDFSYASKAQILPYESRKLGGKKTIINQTTDVIDEMSNSFKSYMNTELSASEK